MSEKENTNLLFPSDDKSLMSQYHLYFYSLENVLHETFPATINLHHTVLAWQTTSSVVLANALVLYSYRVCKERR